MDCSSCGWIEKRSGLGGRERMASYARLTNMKIALRVIALLGIIKDTTAMGLFQKGFVQYIFIEGCN